MAELSDRRIASILCILYVLLIVYSSLMPYDFTLSGREAYDNFSNGMQFWPIGNRHTSKTDLISNALAYVPVGFLVVTAWSMRPGRKRAVGLALAGICAAAMSAAVEAIQTFSPARVSSIEDVAMNIGGALAGGAIAAAVGPELWRKLVGAVRREWVDRPVALVAGVLALLLLADAVYPYRPTLDVSEVWGNVKRSVLSVSDGLAVHAWHHWLVRRVGVYAALSALLAAALGGGGRPRRLTGAVLAVLLAASLEGSKVLITSRVFNIANVVVSAGGAMAGWALGAMLTGLTTRGQLALARRSILCYLIYAAWQPFRFVWGAAATKIPSGPEWLPLYHYAAGGRPIDVRNFVASLVLPAALAFAGRLIERCDGRTGVWSRPALAAIAAGSIGLALELGQLVIATREPNITDVLCFALGGALGSWLAGRREAAIADLSAAGSA
ncbi:hypothetical protein LCGC14_0239140 [marine sediment metagenome]|uniref:VanZ-like domain-containing protein n=1 Tax=marine sediment metagenome TaxID=412755 RepID=A0A0F9UPJ5_9ZZZZ|nr:hypothetical protein [Phycisphaerae bacterium]HDZ42766.1 hypothetical protein [Phycisphaerae bacterium]